MPIQTDTQLLQMALIGYESERQKIQERIADIQRQLNGRTRSARSQVADTPSPRGRRRMSAAARKRIAAAQKARWAAFRKKQKAA
jgi:hypothetical protein